MAQEASTTMTESDSIKVGLPSKYTHQIKTDNAPSGAPSVEWLSGTWSVTHSTLHMWRSARNVRISYQALPAKSDGHSRLDDLVEYEPVDKDDVRKTVQGVDTLSQAQGWDWRGKGWLFVTSHWEVLAWGEETTQTCARERWAVTWFAPTLFTKEGLDVYCDRREGLSRETFRKIEKALRSFDARELQIMVEKDMKPVEIRLPWVEG